MHPLVHYHRTIGVLCIDSGRINHLPGEREREALRQFLEAVTPVLDQARMHHQQISLARLVDSSKKKEAAFYMVKSAVRLIDKLALASVLVPVQGLQEEGLQVLATYSSERHVRKQYEAEQLISLQPGDSLLSHFINNQGIIINDDLLHPHYIQDLTKQHLQKKFITEELGLQSLYMIPFYQPKTRKMICLVNYYTTEIYKFNSFETGLLRAHAEMAQRVIQEIGDEHMEIQILSEISDLLYEKSEGLQSFLDRVLAKATELIGASTGSVALVSEIKGDKWLLVEDADRNLVGAKSNAWLKKHIPPMRVGGEELRSEQRSLTGYVAYSGYPVILSDVQAESSEGQFYKKITGSIRSEIAVPIISDNDILAVICLDSLQTNYFTAEHKRILQLIGRLISRHLSDLLQIEKLTSRINQLDHDVEYKDPEISSYRLGNIIGNARSSQQTVEFIQNVAPPLSSRISLWHNHPLKEAALGLPSILITGETGSGKEFLFNNIFSRLNELFRAQTGNRESLPISKTNIAAYSGDLTYSELFGHKRGAFTGAHSDRKGILEEANGGVVFLDEIGDADPKTQVQLLRFLDNGGLVRLGDNVTRYARVLVVAATNRDLQERIAKGLFREDLYYRLSELSIAVPSLNERREDIPDLATHFCGRLYRAYTPEDERGKMVPKITNAAQKILMAHQYTGNVRELRSILMRALFFRKKDRLDREDILQAINSAAPSSRNSTQASEKQHTEQQAAELFTSLLTARQEFWGAVHKPYNENNLPRDVVIRIVEMAKAQGSTTMPKIARSLRACDPQSQSPEEKRRFFKFKNFLYKTIKIP